MIIKKQLAQIALQTAEAFSASQPASAPASQNTRSVYEQPLSSLDFESGRIADRRRPTRETDRRQGFRRDDDRALISQAQAEATAIREAAQAQGLSEGLSQAEAEIQQLRETIQDLFEAKTQAYESAAEDIASMAVEVAERIIKTEVSCDETLVLNLVKSTIQRVGRDQKSLLISVHPSDLRIVKEAVKTQQLELSSDVEVIVREDDQVDSGSCTVETRAGYIDAKFSTQLTVLRKILLTGGRF